METKQLSNTVLSSNIQQEYTVDGYNVVARINIANDRIVNINLTVSAKSQAEPISESHQPKSIGFYARAEWGVIGQASYFFLDEISAPERVELIKVFDAVFAEAKVKQALS